ncbi:MAG: protein kinase [Phycisphaerae bacterium]|nr:protein kinase [Phycisphaerae bacterium]
MVPRQSEQSSHHDDRVAALINEYFDRRQAGEGLTPECFATEHPELSDELLPYLEGLSLLDKIRSDAASRPGETRSESGSLVGADVPEVAGYELLEEMGRGGMGVVYKALQVSTKRIVAVKVLLSGPFSSPTARRRFAREVELAARLQHPNIVRVLESGRVAHQQYYAMDYVAGAPLNQYLTLTEPDVRTTLSLFERICQAVEHAHERGVIHRDLKPANVLVDDEGEPHILDFGLAKTTDQDETEEALTTRVSMPGQVVGTLFYLSPEQATGVPDQIDVRTDVYSLGVMLFEALTGSLPFDTAGRPSEIIQRILEAPPSSLSNRVDSELSTIVLKALAKEKDRRYPSATEMAADIRRYVEGEPILARRPSSFYLLRKKVLKHRRAAILCVVVVVATFAALVARSHWRQQRWAQTRWTVLQAQRTLEAGDTVSASSNAKVVCSKRPRVEEARLTYAQALYRNGATRVSGPVSLERSLPHAPVSSQWAYRLLMAEMYRGLGDAERADALQAQAEHQAPDTTEGWYLRSFTTLDLQRALKCARQATRCSAGGEPHTLAWARLAYLRLQVGDLDGAFRTADRLLELGAPVEVWTVFKGKILARQGRFHEAIEHYTRAGDYTARAHAYRRIGEHAKAVEDYTRQLGREGETVLAWHHYQRGTPLWILGRTDEALKDYERVRALLGRPGFSDARRFLILRELDRNAEAREVLDAALREVESPSWLRQVFRCLAREIKPDELVADAVARDDPEAFCEACYYAGEACLLSSDFGRAREWFERCVQTGVEFDPNTSLLTPMNEYELAQWRLDTPPRGE